MGKYGKIWEKPLSIMEHSLKSFFLERSTHYEWEMVTLNHNSWVPVLVLGYQPYSWENNLLWKPTNFIEKKLGISGRIPPAENHLW